MMRERTRRRVAAEAQSHRATPEELRDASKRIKEIEQELRELPLSEEAKQGEPRERRYARLLRLRAMREDFVGDRPVEGAHPNGYLLSLVMTIASFMLCAFCAGSLYIGVQLLNQKPNPADTAAAYWGAVESKNYGQIYSTYLSSKQRVSYQQSDFVTNATQADSDYGAITKFLQVGQPVVSGQQATIVYQVTRGGIITYKCTLALVLRGGTWYIDDPNSTFAPSLAGVPTPTTQPTARPSPTATSTSTG
jgi:hypothetical protein